MSNFFFFFGAKEGHHSILIVLSWRQQCLHPPENDPNIHQQLWTILQQHFLNLKISKPRHFNFYIWLTADKVGRYEGTSTAPWWPAAGYSPSILAKGTNKSSQRFQSKAVFCHFRSLLSGWCLSECYTLLGSISHLRTHSWALLSQPGCEPRTCLQTTETSDVDVWTKLSISHSHDLLFSRWLQQNMQLKVVYYRPKRLQGSLSPVIFLRTCGHFLVFFHGKLDRLQLWLWRQNRYNKTYHVLSWS